MQRRTRSTSPAVEVEHLTKTYPGGVEAVKDVSFAVAPGEVFGLLGPNGAGKSTTVGMLTTTVRPTAEMAALMGHILYLGTNSAPSVTTVRVSGATVNL